MALHVEFVILLQLFLLHIDEIISCMCGKEPYGGLLGSTSICCDQETKVMKETKVTKETKVKKETTVTKETKVMKFD